MLTAGQTPISPLSGAGLADIGDRVVDQSDMPFLDCYVEQVTEQGEFEADGVVCFTLGKPVVAVAAHEVRRDGRQ
ncbi:hypothetical protein WT54_19630 [Burkholderia territorii]|nr:hypothetical protein WT54_19630 [Burkholderia territorii]